MKYLNVNPPTLFVFLFSACRFLLRCRLFFLYRAMIRRSPTRIELKLDDLHDFEYISKIEKKKSTNTSTLQQQEKIARHERIAGAAGGAHPPTRAAHGAAGRAAAASAAVHPPQGHGGAPTTPAAAADDSGSAGDSSTSVREDAVWVGEWTPEERLIPPYTANHASLLSRRRHNAAAGTPNTSGGADAGPVTPIPTEEDGVGGASSINNSTMMSLDESL